MVSLDLDIGSYDLGIAECRELICLLGQRAGQPDASAALACARRLEVLVDEEGRGSHILSERQLDALADVAWDWVRRSGADAVPERILRLLDALRARHGRD